MPGKLTSWASLAVHFCSSCDVMLQTALVSKRHDERAGRREVRYLRHILCLEMAAVSGALSLARTLLAAVGGPPPCVAASATGGAWRRALASCARGLYMQLVAVRYGRVMNVVELMDAAGPAQQSLLANALHDFSLLAGALLSLAAQLLADAPGSEVLAEALPEAGLPWRGLLAAPDVGRVHSTCCSLGQRRQPLPRMAWQPATEDRRWSCGCRSSNLSNCGTDCYGF